MDKNLGVYIHIPFCVGKCAYCDFYSLSGHEKLMPSYQHALLHHIREYAPQLDGYLTDTVYFGGGTPSYYGSDRLVAIFSALKKYGHVLLEAEVTVEVNPECIAKADLIRLRRAGFNRLSVGVRRPGTALLRAWGASTRSPTPSRRFKRPGGGNQKHSIDLIYGLPSRRGREGPTRSPAQRL
jgi:oxygen-independent coproporphyrinogen-3 oxidase